MVDLVDFWMELITQLLLEASKSHLFQLLSNYVTKHIMYSVMSYHMRTCACHMRNRLQDSGKFVCRRQVGIALVQHTQLTQGKLSSPRPKRLR